MNIVRIIKAFLAVKWLKKPNVHLPSGTAILTKIGEGKQAYVRPSFSDQARIREYLSSIYFSKCYLQERVKKSRPKTIIDVGANIGLSSLSLLEEFPSVSRVVAIEAEIENYGVLKRNFEFWKDLYPDVEFEAVHAIATGEAGVAFVMSKLGNENNSASGTFKFTPSEHGQTHSVAMRDLVSAASGPIICKMDIEGGEKFIFQSDASWLEDVAFFTAEVHDRFGPEFVDSSADMIAALKDFAIVPDRDVLHCYRRNLPGQ